MRASLIALLSLVAAASSLGCGTVEVPRICFTEQGISVPGSTVSGTAETPPVAFAIDLGNQIPLLRTSTSDSYIRVVEVSITPVAGNPDLSGVETARVQVQTASGAQDVASYQRSASAPPPAAIVLEGDTVNIAPHLVEGRANLSFRFSGQPPRTSWTANLETCVRGEASVSP